MKIAKQLKDFEAYLGTAMNAILTRMTVKAIFGLP
jgi:hypothetical protein